ncbi:MAG: hypothetical protein ACC651_13865 [Candidatus Scalindua sp.]
MGEKTYTRDLGEGARKRHYHRTEKGKVVYFAVQLELEIRDKCEPVIRYDCSHKFAHIDRYNISGDKVKEDIYLTYEDGLTLADEDININ